LAGALPLRLEGGRGSRLQSTAPAARRRGSASASSIHSNQRARAREGRGRRRKKEEAGTKARVREITVEGDDAGLPEDGDGEDRHPRGREQRHHRRRQGEDPRQGRY